MTNIRKRFTFDDRVENQSDLLGHISSTLRYPFPFPEKSGREINRDQRHEIEENNGGLEEDNSGEIG